jgi:hypothetical protein
MVVLHEIAHLMAPYSVYHERQWAKIVARLYIKYGGPETVEWAYHHERRGGDALKRRLPHGTHRCPEAQATGMMNAVHGLVADLKATA